MRFEIQTQTVIDAPRAVVWSILTDLPAYASWNPFMVESAGTVAVGERLTNRMSPPGGREMTFRPVVTEVEEGRVLEWLGHLGVRGLFDGRHRFGLTDVDGGTRLDHGETFTGLLVRPLHRSLDARTRQGFEMMNEALRTRAEERAGS